MAFSITDFRDLLAVLDQHPEWRAELRRQVLTDEILELPAIVARLAERMDALTERMDALTERMDALTERMDALTERMDDLVQAQRRTEAQLGVLVGRVGTMAGDMLELRYARRAPAYFSRLARRLRVIEPGPLADRLDDAVDAGRLAQAERDAVMEADLVLTGRRREDGTDIYLLAELSVGVGLKDVDRAIRRSSLLGKMGTPVIPIVAGEWIDAEAQRYASASGVEVFLDRPRRLPTEP